MFIFSVERVLTGGMRSVRESLLTRYVMFLQSLYASSTRELRILSNTASSDARSVTGNNLAKMAMETPSLEVRSCSKLRARLAFMNKSSVPVEEEWRAPLLARLLQEKMAGLQADMDNNHLDSMIEVMCSSTF